MTPQRFWLHHWLQSGCLALCTGALLLSTAPLVLAKYVPPPRPSTPKQGTTTSTGVRGSCGTEAKIPLTAIAPVQHVGQTTVTRPTIAWFVPNQTSHPLELTLFEAGEKGRGKSLYTTKLPSTPGIMTFTLPKDQPELTPGKQYIWQVAMICNPNRPSQDRWVEAVMEVVATPPDLKPKLARTTNPLQRSQLYGSAGFWYDALAEALKAPDAKAARLTLLKDLSQLEGTEQQMRLDAIATLLEQSP